MEVHPLIDQLGLGPRGAIEEVQHLSKLPGGATVLFLGETGVGKTEAARRLHRGPVGDVSRER